MKKIISTILMCALLVGCVFTFASCGNVLMGEYELDAGLVEVTYKFGLSKVTITYEDLLGNEKTEEGKYKIAKNDDGETEITFTFENEEETKDYSGTFSFEKGKEGDDKFIKIGGVKYTKED